MLSKWGIPEHARLPEGFYPVRRRGEAKRTQTSGLGWCESAPFSPLTYTRKSRKGALTLSRAFTPRPAWGPTRGVHSGRGLLGLHSSKTILAPGEGIVGGAGAAPVGRRRRPALCPLAQTHQPAVRERLWLDSDAVAASAPQRSPEAALPQISPPKMFSKVSSGQRHPWKPLSSRFPGQRPLS